MARLILRLSEPLVVDARGGEGEVRELGTGRSRQEILASLGYRARVAPKMALEDGIAVVRTILPRCWFDRLRCRQGLDYLREYRAQYDEKRQVLSNRPLHDRASHAADAFRVLATAHRSAVARPGKLRRRELAWIV